MILGDCLEMLPALQPSTAHLVFADIPYAVSPVQYTKNPWDVAFPVPALMAAIDTAAQHTAARLFTCGDRLAAAMAHTFPSLFRYSLIWHKARASLYFHANKRPLVAHEYVQVFGPPTLTYNPQFRPGKSYRHNQKTNHRSSTQHETSRTPINNTGTRFPRSVLSFPADNMRHKGIHPTQKPLALLDWLVRTYSNPGDTVLDPVAGSGTTAHAAILAGRSVTCIERDRGYFEASVERVRKAARDEAIDATIEVRT